LPEVEVTSKDGMLFIYRPVFVGPILDSAPDFYQAVKGSEIDAIVRVSALGMNGDLLGYGARSVITRPAHAVRILKGDVLALYYFVSDPDPEHAAGFARERAMDFVRAFGWDDVRFELEKIE